MLAAVRLNTTKDICKLKVTRDNQRIRLAFLLNLNKVKDSSYILISSEVSCESATSICSFIFVIFVVCGVINLMVFCKGGVSITIRKGVKLHLPRCLKNITEIADATTVNNLAFLIAARQRSSWANCC